MVTLRARLLNRQPVVDSDSPEDNIQHTRNQTRAVSDYDSSDGDIQHTKSQIKSGNTNGFGLRKGKHDENGWAATRNATQTKRKRENDSPWISPARKKSKRAPAAKAATTTKAKNPKRAAHVQATEDGNSSEADAALDVINSFAKPKSSHVPPNTTSIEIPLPRGRGNLAGRSGDGLAQPQQDNADEGEGDRVPMELNDDEPELGSILVSDRTRQKEFRSPEAPTQPDANNAHETESNRAVPSDQSTIPKSRLIPVRNAVLETPQPLRPDHPIPTIETPMPGKDWTYGPDAGGQEELPVEEQDNGHEYEARAEPSPDLSSDPPRNLYDIAEEPENDSAVFKSPVQTVKTTINGLAGAKANKGKNLVPKAPFLSSPASSTGPRQFLDVEPRRPPVPTTAVENRLHTGQHQSQQPLGSSPPQREITAVSFNGFEFDDYEEQPNEHADEDEEANVRLPVPNNNDPINLNFGFLSDEELPVREHERTLPQRQAGSTSGAAPRISGHNDSLMIQAPATPEAQNTTSLASQEITRLHQLMGAIGWTELRDTWDTRLLEPDPFDTDATNTPALTKLGKLFFKTLVTLKAKLATAPSAPSFDAQNRWLQSNEQALSKTTSEISKLITRICEDRLAVLGDSARPSSNDLSIRAALVRDLVVCIIPLLILVLHAAFRLGGAPDDDLLLPEEGEFTTSSMQYLARVTGWLARLDRVLMYELGLRPLNGPGYELLSAAQKKLYPGKSAKKRALLGKLLGRWDEEMKGGVEELEEAADKERKRAERLRREVAIKEEKRRREEEEGREAERKWAAFAASTQGVRRVVEEEERRKVEAVRGFAGTAGGWSARTGTITPASATQQQPPRLTQRQREKLPERRYFTVEDEDDDYHGNGNGFALENEHNAQLPEIIEVDDNDEDDPFASSSSSSEDEEVVMPNHPPPRPPPPVYPPWDNDDKLSLLQDMREIQNEGREYSSADYKAFAEVSKRSVDDIMAQAQLLRMAARMLARERKIPVEDWALEEVPPRI